MDAFAKAVLQAERDMGGKGIGTIGEKSLHLTLKYYFAPDPETHERPLGGFIADAVTEDGVIEIQTRGLSKLKPKLDAFLAHCPVTVVHPAAVNKWLCKVDENGTLRTRRKSPKHESVYTAMREIYTLRDYISNPQFRLCICEIETDEYIVTTEKRRREKLDRVPIALHSVRVLDTPADYAALLPESLPETFTVQMLSAAIAAPEMQTRLFLSLCTRMKITEEAGKNGRMKLWRRCVSDAIRR